MSIGDMVRRIGTVAPCMCIERVIDGIAHVSWFWNNRLERSEVPVAELEDWPKGKPLRQ